MACHGEVKLRRENIRGAILVPAPALSYKHISASYGREVIQCSRPIPAPAVTLASLAGRLAVARYNALPLWAISMFDLLWRKFTIRYLQFINGF